MKKYFKHALYVTVAIFWLLACDKDDPISDNNQPPVADAGIDQVLPVPSNSALLDGSKSKDPDGTIIRYEWKKESGPEGAVIEQPNAVKTTVSMMVEGAYTFLLKVTDNKGATASDRVQVVIAANNSCVNLNRPTLNLSFVDIGMLSVARAPQVAAAGNQVIFAGGAKQFVTENGGYYTTPSSAVDIYDIANNSWNTTQLSQARQGMGIAQLDTKIYFAGGSERSIYFGGNPVYDNIDIYDVDTRQWSTAKLSQPRSHLAAAAAGTKIVFAGGTVNGLFGTDQVDIYDASNGSWTTARLSSPRYGIAAVALGNKIYFAGGYDWNNSYNTIDIYDVVNNTWSLAVFQELVGPVSGIVDGQTIYWAGVAASTNFGKVEIWNTVTGNRKTECLTYGTMSPSMLFKSNRIVFGPSTVCDVSPENRMDVLDILSGTWYKATLREPVAGAGIIGINNTMYVGGGTIADGKFSNKVYIVNW